MKLLTIASNPADYIEMSNLADALAGRGHDVTFMYFYSALNPDAHEPVLRSMEDLHRRLEDLKVWLVDIESVPTDVVPSIVIPEAGVAGVEKQRVQKPSRLPSAEKFLRWLREWALRRGLQISKQRKLVRKIVYPLARGLDRLRDPKQLAKDIKEEIAQLPRDFKRMRRELPGLMWAGTPVEMRRAIIMIRIYRCFLDFFQRAMREGAFDAILVPEDVVGYMWPVAIKAGHEHGIPTLVFPYTLANRSEPIQSLKDVPDYQARNNRLAARMYPRWRLKEDQIDLVRLPSPHVFAHEALHITPPDPWMMNSGYADAICVDSAATFEYFRDAGIPPERMEVIGSVSQDVMFELRRDKAAHLAALRTELGLEGEKPLLLVSGCPNQLVGEVPYCEFEDFEAIAAFIGETLAPLADDYHLVVRPHPNFPDFGEMLARHGFATTMIPTSRLVPLADVFVAFASSTIRWAIACGVPTVNYDIFHYGYGDFTAATGVASLDDKAAFRDTVQGLRPTSAAYADLKARIDADSARWSMTDGQSIARIEAAIARASARLRAAAPPLDPQPA